MQKQSDSGEWVTEQVGYGDGEVHWREGRGVGGAAVGVIQLKANIPMVPGNMGNACTFPFALLYQPMEVSGEMVVSSEPHPEVIQRAIGAARELERQGVRAVMGNCGFFANYQPEVAEAITVPFFSSSLLQIPNLLTSIGSSQKVGVITADGPKLTAAPALEKCGVIDRGRVVIVGAEGETEMQRILNTEGRYDPGRLEEQLTTVAKRMVEQDPSIAVILLECTELAPHGHAIQAAVRRPVWDFPTLVNWVYAGLVRRPFTGFV